MSARDMVVHTIQLQQQTNYDLLKAVNACTHRNNTHILNMFHKKTFKCCRHIVRFVKNHFVTFDRLFLFHFCAFPLNLSQNLYLYIDKIGPKAKQSKNRMGSRATFFPLSRDLQQNGKAHSGSFMTTNLIYCKAILSSVLLLVSINSMHKHIHKQLKEKKTQIQKPTQIFFLFSNSR